MFYVMDQMLRATVVAYSKTHSIAIQTTLIELPVPSEWDGQLIFIIVSRIVGKG